MDSFSLLASSLGSLLVILGILACAAWLLRRLRNAQAGRRGAAAGIDIVATRAIGGNNMLLIAEIEGARYLLGTGRNGVSGIVRLGAPQSSEFQSLLNSAEPS